MRSHATLSINRPPISDCSASMEWGGSLSAATWESTGCGGLKARTWAIAVSDMKCRVYPALRLMISGQLVEILWASCANAVDRLHAAQHRLDTVRGEDAANIRTGR